MPLNTRENNLADSGELNTDEQNANKIIKYNKNLKYIRKNTKQKHKNNIETFNQSLNKIKNKKYKISIHKKSTLKNVSIRFGQWRSQLVIFAPTDTSVNPGWREHITSK